MPLWSGAHRHLNPGIIDLIIQNLSIIYDNFPAGFPVSYINSTQQWDYPNSWAPHQWFIIESLMRTNTEASQELAFGLAQKWILTNYCGWNSTGGVNNGMMFEKYNSLKIGQPGQGGEYVVQAGFGWTNGVALVILDKYGKNLKFSSCT